MISVVRRLVFSMLAQKMLEKIQAHDLMLLGGAETEAAMGAASDVQGELIKWNKLMRN